MSAIKIIKASNTIITMDPAKPRAEAVAFDSETGVILAVGDFKDLCTKFPDVHTDDVTTVKVLMPGFIDPHNHPVSSGATTQPPAYWIAPYVTRETNGKKEYPYKTWPLVEDFFRTINGDEKIPHDQPLIFNGLDRMLQGAPELRRDTLDNYFPDRPVLVLDNSGHAAYFNTKLIEGNPDTFPDKKPIGNPTGGSFGTYTAEDQKDDNKLVVGESNGRAYETPAIMSVLNKAQLGLAIPNALRSAALWYALMAKNGITMTSEHTYGANMLEYYVALAKAPHSPLRVGLYHMSTDTSGEPGDKLEYPSDSPGLEARLWKQGIKLWADGSPWVGNLAASFPYQDSKTVNDAQIPRDPGGTKNLNYTPAQLDAILDKYVWMGWQFAFHCNGDVALDVVLDAYQRALVRYGRLGTDHRWRVEHCGACRGDQFARAAGLGIMISLPPFQFIYWGDLLDGEIFSPEIGSQWVRAGDAVRAGARVSFHNDGSVSPPKPLLNIQMMVTRRPTSPKGKVHGPEQAVTLHDALMAHTMNAAYHLRRDHDLGSITVGKLADFVALSDDPYNVHPEFISELEVNGTWSNGKRIDPDAFVSNFPDDSTSPTKPHPHLAVFRRCC
ncbi:amidohydrolase [Polyangium spumosum]|uniref:Amidohydrolase family protein n=1 Tax=Polyangium spumosum TaxID=889282 RepID=A0A6N7PXP8_9BACT|nr:amidohydrolase family protein [Polyangium spumosum]MRG96307.1 amidohydrolase family protein [Polyangium spumosum]